MSTTLAARSLVTELERIERLSLSPVERLLLVTDGTVTKLLEALLREPVQVSVLDRTPEDERVVRRVVLRTDDRDLVWARSTFYPSQIDDEVARTLTDAEAGIDSTLNEELGDTRRELLSVRVFDGEETPDFVGATGSEHLVRTYEIYADGRAVAKITEYFPREQLP